MKTYTRPGFNERFESRLNTIQGLYSDILERAEIIGEKCFLECLSVLNKKSEDLSIPDYLEYIGGSEPQDSFRKVVSIAYNGRLGYSGSVLRNLTGLSENGQLQKALEITDKYKPHIDYKVASKIGIGYREFDETEFQECLELLDSDEMVDLLNGNDLISTSGINGLVRFGIYFGRELFREFTQTLERYSDFGRHYIAIGLDEIMDKMGHDVQKVDIKRSVNLLGKEETLEFASRYTGDNMTPLVLLRTALRVDEEDFMGIIEKIKHKGKNEAYQTLHKLLSIAENIGSEAVKITLDSME